MKIGLKIMSMIAPTHCVERTADGVLRVTVDLPLLDSMTGVDLSLGANSLALREAKAGYSLDLTLQHPVEETKATARFARRSRVLTISMPLRAEAAPAAGGSRDLQALVHAGWQLGQHVALLRELGVATAEGVEAAHFDDCTYVNVRAAGLSLAFDGPTPSERRLGCLHLFSGGADGYGRCPLALPCGLVFEMVGKEVVETLGEPQRKGGGGKRPIFLVYARLGLQVALAATSWDEGGESCVASVDVFTPE